MSQPQSVSPSPILPALGWMVAPTRLLGFGCFGVGLAVLYILARGTAFPYHIAALQSPAIGLFSAVCAGVYVIAATIYFASLSGSRAALEREAQGHLTIVHALQARKVKAERAREAKSDFLAKMSHELRTPINAVIGYSEMLLEDMIAAGREEQGTDIRKIADTGKFLLALINDVLDLSKIDAGKMGLYPERTALGRLLSDMAPGCTTLVAANGNMLVLDVPEEGDAVELDLRKFRQIVSNLVKAASSAARDGKIVVAARLKNGGIDLTIRNAGGRVVAENLAALLQNFGEAAPADMDNQHDTGLGTALARKLCRLMNGDVEVESEGKSGLRFTVRIAAQTKT